MEKNQKKEKPEKEKISFLTLSWAWLIIVIINAGTYFIFKDGRNMQFFFLLLYVYICTFIIPTTIWGMEKRDKNIFFLWQAALGIFICSYEYLQGKNVTVLVFLSIMMLIYNFYCSKKKSILWEVPSASEEFQLKMTGTRKVFWGLLLYQAVKLLKGSEMTEIVFFDMYFFISLYTMEYAKYMEKEQKERKKWLVWQIILGIVYGLQQSLMADLFTAITIGGAIFFTLFIIAYSYIMTCYSQKKNNEMFGEYKKILKQEVKKKRTIHSSMRNYQMVKGRNWTL